MSLAEDLYVSPEEYLERERAAEYKSEYINGRIYAMSGGTFWHGVLAVNASSELRRVLHGRNCRVSSSDVRVKVPESQLYTYPDVSVVCGDAVFHDRRRDTVVNPSVLVEVLSPSTERYDRRDKWAHYQLLPSLRHYLLVSQDRVRVEYYTRLGESSSWRMDVATSLQATVKLEHLGVELSVAEIYLGVEFDAEAEQRS